MATLAGLVSDVYVGGREPTAREPAFARPVGGQHCCRLRRLQPVASSQPPHARTGRGVRALSSGSGGQRVSLAPRLADTAPRGAKDVDPPATVALTAPLAPAGASLEAQPSLAGGRGLLDFIAAWDELSPRLASARRGPPADAASAAADAAQLRTVLEALKLAVPALQRAGAEACGRPRARVALDVACSLADLGADGATVAAALLAEAVAGGGLALGRVAAAPGLGEPLAALLADVLRVRELPAAAGAAGGLDDAAAARLRTFCLEFHDTRAVLVRLAGAADALRHARALPAWRAGGLALEAMALHAPLAHALGEAAGPLRAELEDGAFALLFPASYAAVRDWLAQLLPAGEAALAAARDALEEALEEDAPLTALLGGGWAEVRGRAKSRYSTMRKLLRDGRPRGALFDLLGLRVVLHGGVDGRGPVPDAAAYRAQQLAHRLYPPLAGREKDYVAAPKANGYASLHSTLVLPPPPRPAGRPPGDCEEAPPPPPPAPPQPPYCELQVRTAQMEAHAEAGGARHAFYKGGVAASPRAAAALAEAAAAVQRDRFARFLPPGAAALPPADAVFAALDADCDGKLSLQELAAAVGELGGEPGSAQAVALELLRLADTDESGAVSRAECVSLRIARITRPLTPSRWDAFRSRVAHLRSLPEQDARTERSLQRSLGCEGAEEAEEAEPAPAAAAAVAPVYADAGAAALGPPPSASAAAAAAALEARAAARGRAMAAADALCAAGELEAACGALREATQADPAFSAGWTRWAGLEAEAGRWEAAVALHDAAARWAAGPAERARALLRAALLTDRSGRPSAARPLFRRAAAAAAAVPPGPDASRAPTLHAWALFESRQGAAAEALRLLEEAMALEPGNGALLHARGCLEAQAGRPAAAARAFERALAAQPGDARVLQAWGCLEARRGRLHAARGLFSAALQGHPRNCYVVQAWALAELRAGGLQAAHALLRHGLATDAGSAPLWAAWAQLQRACGGAAAARGAYAQGLEACPLSVQLMQQAARLEREDGRPAEARALLQRALRLEPHAPNVLAELAEVEAAEGAHEAAAALREQAQTQAPPGWRSQQRRRSRPPRWKLAGTPRQ